MGNYLSVAVDFARQAGKVQMDHLGRVKTIEYKGRINLVTEVDKMCEKLIYDGLHTAFPTHDVLGEEGIATRRESEFRWIVDPLDGTTNYTHQFPFFGVSIALEHKGEITCAVVFDPIREEMFAAEKGKGTTLNGEPVRVSGAAGLKDSLLATGFAYSVHEEGRPDNLDHFANFIKTALAIRRPGAAAIDLAYVACGRLDGFWELFLKPWDIAAGKLLIEEAGGRVTGFNGSPIDIYGTEILASNGKIHDEMSRVLLKK